LFTIGQFTNQRTIWDEPVNEPLVLLVDPNPERRRALAELFAREHFEVLGVAMPEAAQSSPILALRLVALSLLEGGDRLLPFISEWRSHPERARVPLLAIVPADDDELAAAALEAGADDVFRWPATEVFLRGRLRALDELARLRAEVDAFSGVLGSIVQSVEAREPYSIEHAQRVGELATAMARTLRLSAEETDRIGRAASVYDIGMVAIPDRLVHGPRGLSREELSEVRSHPVVGYELLRGLPSIEPLLPFVHRHHERIDGSGYPDGLVGREIPVAVQVLSVADAYDVLTSARPYRPVRPLELAIAILRSEAKRGIWDSELISTLEGVVEPAAQANSA
jgi:putative two-component system response regulator